MAFHKFVLFLLLFSATQGCSSTQPGISGKITPHPDWKPVLYLVQPRSFAELNANYAGIVVDSAVADKAGNFNFKNIPKIERPGLYQIEIQRKESRFANKLEDDDISSANYMPVLIAPGENISITAQSDRFQAGFSIAKPSPDNQALLQVRDIRHLAFAKWQSVMAAIDNDEHAIIEQEKALLEFQQPLMAFADTTKSAWAALSATRWVSPSNDFERVPEFLHRQCGRWSSQQAEMPFVRQLCDQAGAEKLPVLVGDIIPDFPLPTQAGDTVALKSLLGNKLTILDIWASWCAPCRRENREVLAPLWDNYRDKGLQIIGYSIDSGENAWKNAIAKDGAVWPQTSHLTGDETPLMDALRIRTIPANFILDQDGKVLAKNLHGEELRQFIENRIP
ncbi:MAG: TlpA family protein disulfide reductase [Saprospiraceae bacterium]|nr:TlpA family protein disulfide reductase [Saprospiraceae bacterium]